jgi:hypothetical protein
MVLSGYLQYALVCLFRKGEICILSWNSYPSASQVIFSLYGNLAKLLNYRQLCIDLFKCLVLNIDKPIEIHNSECSKTRKLRFYASVNTG